MRREKNFAGKKDFFILSKPFQGITMVVSSPVKREVVGSNPTPGVHPEKFFGAKQNCRKAQRAGVFPAKVIEKMSIVLLVTTFILVKGILTFACGGNSYRR